MDGVPYSVVHDVKLWAVCCVVVGGLKAGVLLEQVGKRICPLI